MQPNNPRIAASGLLCLALLQCAVASEMVKPRPADDKHPSESKDGKTTPAAQAPGGNALARDYYALKYKDYVAGFHIYVGAEMGSHGHNGGYWAREQYQVEEASSEKSYNNLSLLDEDSQVYAGITVAGKREQDGSFREAQVIYQDLIKKYPDALVRVDANGVFVRATEYCQMRLLGMPPADLAFYRTQFDPEAADAFAEAQRQNSMPAFQHIADTMLATSWGDRALLVLGKAALDLGNYQEAYERFRFIKNFFKGGPCDNAELVALLTFAEKKAVNSEPAPSAGKEHASPAAPPNIARTSTAGPGHLNNAANVYQTCPLPKDGLFHTDAVWSHPLPADWHQNDVYSRPVITEDSVLLRHRNIVYCYGLLSGLLRWKNDMGGLVTWQRPDQYNYGAEEVVVADDTVFTNIYKGGPSLAALNLVTGELRWAAGPMAPSDEQSAHMRFEAAPAVDHGVVYAPYIFDRFTGDTHYETVYGVRAFKATDGQVLWDRPISRLPPGKMKNDTGERGGVKIRSFATSPSVHEGIVYTCTNAGTIAAIDGTSGQIRWVIRYPYWMSLHDGIEGFPLMFDSGSGRHQACMWRGQPPIIHGDQMYIAPVDSPLLLAVSLTDGKVRWSADKTGGWPNFGGPGFVAGPTASGEVIAVYGSRSRTAVVLDGATGKVEWTAPDFLPNNEPPIMNERAALTYRSIGVKDTQFAASAPPTLFEDGTLLVSSSAYFGVSGAVATPRGFGFNRAILDVPQRRVARAERSYDGGVLSAAAFILQEDVPKKLEIERDEKTRKRLEMLRESALPQNTDGEFKSELVVTASRFETVFEVRLKAGELSVAYDRAAVEKHFADDDSPKGLLGRAELSMARLDFAAAASALEQSQTAAAPEEVSFREKVNGLYHEAVLHLTRQNFLRQKSAEHLRYAETLMRTANTQPQEIRALFALAEAFEQAGQTQRAALTLQTIIRYYGANEYALSALLFDQDLPRRAEAGFTQFSPQVPARSLHGEAQAVLDAVRSSLPLYRSILSPVAPDLTVRVETLAAARLHELLKRHPEAASSLESDAQNTLSADQPAELCAALLREFPSTAAAQQALEKTAKALPALSTAIQRKNAWRLAEAAHLAALTVPESLSKACTPLKELPAAAAVAAATGAQTVELENQDNLRLLLETKTHSNEAEGLIFIGGRARKRLDNKFTLECFDSKAGHKRWATPEIRLKGSGQESGFFEAFPVGPNVIVHGLFDVLAYRITNGELAWRYRVPNEFQIANVALAGHLLVLAGDTGTLALDLARADQAELAWQTREEGSVYLAPYGIGDRLVLVRHFPANVTVRSLGTGNLIGRLSLSGLNETVTHPVLQDGPEEVSAAHCGSLLFLNDGWRYMLIDTHTPSIRWVREIDSNDPRVEPPIRVVMTENTAIVTKVDFSQPAMYGLNLATGEIAWQKVKGLPPLYDVTLAGQLAYGIAPLPKKAFRVVAFDPATGALTSDWNLGNTPADIARLLSARDEQVVVAALEGQSAHLLAVDLKSRATAAALEHAATGPLGLHGRVSVATSAGRLLLLSQNALLLSDEK